MTELIRSDAPRRSAMAGIALGGVVIGALIFSFLTAYIALEALNGTYPAESDFYMGLFMGLVFILAAIALDIYRKEFMPDELIHKIRRPKLVPPRTFR